MWCARFNVRHLRPHKININLCQRIKSIWLLIRGHLTEFSSISTLRSQLAFKKKKTRLLVFKLRKNKTLSCFVLGMKSGNVSGQHFHIRLENYTSMSRRRGRPSSRKIYQRNFIRFQQIFEGESQTLFHLRAETFSIRPKPLILLDLIK